MSSRVILEIDLAGLRENFKNIARHVAPAGVMAVLKANAYGLGILPVARSLAEAGAAGFGVAELNEALSLVPLGLPVMILGGLLPDEIIPAVETGVILPLTDIETARCASKAATVSGRPARCHFLIDTGMRRLGILQENAIDTIREATRLPGLHCEGIYSHFPVAYRAGASYTNNQISGLRSIIDRLVSEGIVFAFHHIANSDALNNFPESYAPPFNLVRTGINLYGAFDIEGHKKLQLRSVLSLKARLAAVRRLRAGMSIGYGCTYTLSRDTLVGTVAAGYADGLPLALSNRGHVLIHGRCCPVLGRVSMDYTTVSLEQAPEACRGDTVICLGGEGPTAVSVEDWAQLKGTHPYEIIGSIGSRVARVYLNNE